MQLSRRTKCCAMLTLTSFLAVYRDPCFRSCYIVSILCRLILCCMLLLPLSRPPPGEATLTVLDSNVYGNTQEWSDKFRPKVVKQRNTGF
jgi:hypothetical protein